MNLIERLSARDLEWDNHEGTMEFTADDALLMQDAAAAIGRLEGILASIAEFCSGELGTLGAVERLIQIRKIASNA